MKRNQLITLLYALFLLLVLFAGSFEKSFAQEGAGVSVRGEITLFEESTTTSSKKPPQISDASSDDQIIPKPKGRMPSTGELVKNSMVISGILLIGTICLVYVLKRHRQKNRKGQ